MKKIEEHGCILAAHQFGLGVMGHWIVFMIYPQDGNAVIFDSLRETNKKGYKDFEYCLQYAYRKYVEDPESYDRRSEKKKQKYGTKLRIRQQFSCASQPEWSVLCGYYACDYLRCCVEYSRSWRQLKKSTRYWRRQKVDKTIIKHTISDICKFVTDECCSVDGKVFNHESELAMEPKYKSLRNWRTELKMKDYKLPDLF